MTALEKQGKVKEILSRMCWYSDGCPNCNFFKPEDETDGEFFCAIRDSKKLVPFDDEWDMESAMIGECDDREMRYLFRGKRTDNGEWVEGYFLKIDGISYILPLGLDLKDIVEVDSETVCQYTGLTDKNGRKIFDGNICKDGDCVVRILWNDKHQWGVEISKADNVLSKGLIFPLWQYDNCKENGYRTLEVIGNIFDNPDLINWEMIGK